MSKLTRVTQKVFGSQAGSAQLAKFGSFAAGSPVVFGPSGIGSIQALNQYLQGWFPSVVNGAAPAIEDMNSLHYLYAYQLAYLFQEGIAEYDASTTYFLNSMVKSGNQLYTSTQDNNTGNAVTNTSFWQPMGLSTLPASSVLSGTYGGLIVAGNASLGSDTTVNGDLIVLGDLNNQGGFALTVNGDTFVNGTFNFTPTSLATPQGNVTLNGLFQYYNPSQFKVNPGQNPILGIGSDMIGNQQNFDGSGQPEANGLFIFSSGRAIGVNFIVDGGDSANTADAGHGGQIQFTGGFDFCSVHGTGGNSTFSGFSAGTGAQIVTFGSLGLSGNLIADGGNVTTGPGTGGSANNISIGGKVYAANSSGSGRLSFSAKGGNSDAGRAGDGGLVSIDSASFVDFVLDAGNSVSGQGGDCNGFLGNGGLQNEFFINCSVSAKGGNGGTDGGRGGQVVAQGGCTLLSLNVRGGDGVSGNGGQAGPVTSNGPLTMLGPIVQDGGNGNAGTGTGGDSVALTINGVFSTNSTVSQVGGTGNTPGANGTTAVTADARMQSLAVGNSAAATTPGTVTHKIEVFDVSGNSLGFVPVYDNIT